MSYRFSWETILKNNRHWKHNLIMLLPVLLTRLPLSILLNTLIFLGDASQQLAMKITRYLPALKRDYDK